MPIPLPKRSNVRTCTHIKVTGQQCGSPALRGEFFCYFHTRVIKGVQQRVDMQLHSMALLEDCESIQLSIMHVVNGLIKGTLDPTRARLIIQALRIAARNAKNVRFDDIHYRESEQPMVREVPNYAQQYLIEHPEFGPPISSECDTDAIAREANPVGRGPSCPRDAKKLSSPAQSKSRATKLRTKRIPRNRNAKFSRKTKRASIRENRRTSREAATEHSPRRKPRDTSQKQSSSEGAKEFPQRIQGRQQRKRIRPHHASPSRNPRSPGRQLARPQNRLRIRRHLPEQRNPIVT